MDEKYIYLPEYQENANFSLDESGVDLRRLFIEGPTLVYDKINANGRNYGKKLLTESINKHTGNGNLESGGCVGELNHPLGQRSQTDPDRISHKFVSVEDTGEYFKTKALIAEKTVSGKQVSGLYDAGIRMGISSRGFGAVTKNGNVKDVTRLYLESLGDIVFNPSAPGAYMQAIRESCSQEYIMVAGNLVLNDSNIEQLIESHNDIINKASIRNINKIAIDIFREYIEKCIY